MSVSAYSARAYQATEEAVADPQRTVVLLYEGAVRFLHQAREAMTRGDHHAQCQALLKAQRILSALTTALDSTHQPDLTASLATLYTWAHARLTEASMSDDQALLNEVIEALTSIRDAWRQAEINCRAA